MDAASRELLRTAARDSAREGYQRWQQRVTGTLPVAEARPVPSTRAPRGRSATEQAEALAGLLVERAGRVAETAVAETRHYLSKALVELAGATAEDVALMQYAGEESEVTDAYRAGLLLAARLVSDPSFEL